MELKIYKLEDRLTVSSILVKNGYEVAQKKRPKGLDGRSIEYYLDVKEVEDDVRVQSK